MIKCMQKILGPIGTNVYLLINDEKKAGVLIDPAFSPSSIKDMINKADVSLEGILLTHGHSDHCEASDQIREAYNTMVYAGKAEKLVLETPEINLSRFNADHSFTVKYDRLLEDGEELELAGIKIICLSTPGHTVGGMSYYIPEADLLFSGDTLFYGSVGRTDFPGGSMSDIVRSIKDKLMVLPDNTQVLPGHGELTSIEFEKENNPFL